MHLRVIVNGSTRIYYDTHDGPEIDEAAADEVDLYLKRSYASAHVPDRLKGKVHPLGLNYAVYQEGVDLFEIRRALAFQPSGQARLKLLARLVGRGFSMKAVTQGYRPTVAKMQAPPCPQDPPRVLFMARAWDPFDQLDRAPQRQEERAAINETRARCVLLLRKEFGPAFSGGFKHTEYALKHYRHVLLEDPARASKRNYVELLAAHPICVATTGLHGSIGWKFAEYVAFSKAIVSERLNYEVPGDMVENRNYLEFRTPEECVEKAVELYRDAERRRAMMEANHHYYLEYLRPDQLILRTLEAAFPARRDASGTL
jgi:hypothetical protein